MELSNGDKAVAAALYFVAGFLFSYIVFGLFA
jgi:hypothetical protein